MSVIRIKRMILWACFPMLKVYNYAQSKRYAVNVLTTSESLECINKDNLSVCRLGDGEFDLINGKDLPFQKYTPEISQRLRNILEAKEDIPQLKVAMPSAYKHLNDFNMKSQMFWMLYFKDNRKWLYERLNKNYVYFDAQITRIYINRKSVALAEQYFHLWKSIWDEKDLLIVEGEKSRFGIGNDLFDNAKSIRRILCPAENAYEKYADIFACVSTHADGRLVLCVLGPTATILAFDLAKLGMRTLDMGNLDMEYEWFRRGASEKLKIPGKYSLEVDAGTVVDDCMDVEYSSQIIARIG